LLSFYFIENTRATVYGGENIKPYVNIRAEIAKNKKERTIRIGDDIQRAFADFISWNEKEQAKLPLPLHPHWA